MIKSASLSDKFVRAYYLILILGALAIFLGPAPVAHAAAITVNSPDDIQAEDGKCTLREAIINANNNDQSGSADCAAGSGADTITFSLPLLGTISLTSALPTITDDLTIIGPGASFWAISGNNSVRVFDIGAVTVNISGFNIKNGNAGPANGGAINTSGSTLTLTSVAIISNTANIGGGLYITGTTSAITVTNSNFSNNLASGTDGFGGAIDHDGGTLVISGTNFVNNSTSGSGGSQGYAGAIDNDGGTLTITSSTFISNTSSPNDGGAIWTSIPTTITNSTFTGNSAAGYAGAILNQDGALYISGSTFLTNTASTRDGGAIWTNASTTITHTVFSGNTATSEYGGAITHADGALAIANSTFSASRATFGGAILTVSGTLTLNASTFVSNTATTNDGGAIWTGIPITISNSTFSSNSAIARGGAIFNQTTLTSTIVNSTLSNNSASGSAPSAPARTRATITKKGKATSVTRSPVAVPSQPRVLPAGGAIYNTVTNTVILTNTILANNTTGGNCGGTMIADGGNNLQFNPSSGCGGTIASGDPRLGPLANNGGPTQTMALLPGSAAVNAGNNAVCAAPPVKGVDQRGVARPQPPGGACDIGAFEAQFQYLFLPLIKK